MSKKLIINSPIEISELDSDKPYIELTTRLCYLDYLNLNGVGLSSNATESFDTLKDMPIVAKINQKGDKFGSHEVTKTFDGKVNFGTNAYGTHTEVWVEDDEVDIPNIGIKTVPCLFAKSKIWKRFSNVVDLIIKKMEDPDNYNGGLYSSWELQGGDFHIVPGGKMYDTFTFLSNCLIDVLPAYGENSKTLSVASVELSNNFEDRLSEALNKDIISLSNNDEDTNIKNKIPQEGGTNMAKNKNEQSALSMTALEQKLWEKINPKGWSSNPYYSVMNIYPEEHKVLCRDWDKTDEELVIYTYSVDENDEIALGEGVETKLSKVLSEKTQVNIDVKLDDTAKLLSEKEINIKELETQLAEKETKITEIETELSEKIDAITKLGEEVTNLKSQIAELEPFKQQFEEAEAQRKEQELADKKESLKEFATKSGYVTKEELETSEEIKAMIEEVDEKGLKALIAERVVESIKSKETKVETSSIKTDINNDESGMLSAVDVMRLYLGKK